MGRRSSAAPRSDNSGKAEAEADPSPKPRPAPKRAPAADDSWGTERTGEMRRDRGGDWEFRGSARLASAKNAESGCALRASASCPRLPRCPSAADHGCATTAGQQQRQRGRFGTLGMRTIKEKIIQGSIKEVARHGCWGWIALFRRRQSVACTASLAGPWRGVSGRRWGTELPVPTSTNR